MFTLSWPSKLSPSWSLNLTRLFLEGGLSNFKSSSSSSSLHSMNIGVLISYASLFLRMLPTHLDLISGVNPRILVTAWLQSSNTVLSSIPGEWAFNTCWLLVSSELVKIIPSGWLLNTFPSYFCCSLMAFFSKKSSISCRMTR